MTDYRSHLSVTLWAALVTLALSAVLELPRRVFSANIFGSPVSFTFTAETLVGLVAVAVVCAGLEAAIRTHPKPELLSYTFRYWGLPSAVVMVAAALLPVAPTQAWKFLTLAATGAILAAALIAEYHTVDPDDHYYRSARVVLILLTYALAALAFVLIYQARSRSLVSASLIGGIAGLLTMEFLRTTGYALRQTLPYSLVTALVMAQSTWVLNYWPFPSVRVGLILLVVFYLLVELAQQGLLGRLKMRQAAEYMLLAALAIFLLRWFPL